MLKTTDTIVPSRNAQIQWTHGVYEYGSTKPVSLHDSAEAARTEAHRLTYSPDNLEEHRGEQWPLVQYTSSSRATSSRDGVQLGQVYAIASENLKPLSTKLKRLSTKAAKLGIEPPTWTEVGIVERERQERDGLGVKRFWTQRLTALAVSSTTVAVAGYQFVATLEGFKGEDGEYRNVLRINPSIEDSLIPHEYRERGPVCDHCGTERRRNQTFLVRKAEDGSFLQVGRNCLADFIGGKDSADAARLASYERDLAVALADGEGGGGYASVSMSTSILAFLSTVATHVRNSGWVSRGAARIDGGQATADEVLLRLHPVGAKEEQEAATLAAECPVEERDTAEAEATLEWVRGLDVDTDIGDSDYLWNLYATCSLGTVQPKEAGIVASAVAAYQRHLGKLRQRERQQSLAETSRHIGAKGDKIGTKLTATDKRKGANLLAPIPVTLTRIGGFEGHYGYTWILQLVTTDGSVLKWFSSRNTDSQGESLTEGEDYILTGSIKSHGDYKGVAETSVTRATLTPAAAAK